MPKIIIIIDHDLGQNEATNRIKDFLKNSSQIPNQISNLKIFWDNNVGHFTFNVATSNISGGLNILPSQIKLEGQIPFIFYPLKNQIQKIIFEYGKSILKK